VGFYVVADLMAIALHLRKAMENRVDTDHNLAFGESLGSIDSAI